MVAFSIRTIVDASSAVAVAMHASCPTRQPSPKKLPVLQNPDDGFFPLLRDHGELDPARLDIEDSISRVPLRNDNLPLEGHQHGFPLADLSEKVLGVEPQRLFARHQ